jgi:23S rRNA (cytidine1920-2'-O)/16S rRNA (cytidine1409-2'-O)-methyltransferase
VALVKPQFEVGRGAVGRGGIVRDPGLHLAALRAVAEAAESAGLAVTGACPSPIRGAEGNREFFLRLEPRAGRRDPAALGGMLEEAVHDEDARRPAD